MNTAGTSTDLVPVSRLSAYELDRLSEIYAWQSAPPDWGTRVMAQPGRVAAMAAQRLVPVGVLRASLRALDQVAGRLSGQREVLRAAGLDALVDVERLSLEDCDRLARRVERRAMAMAGAGGAVFGVGGAASMMVDIPTLLTMALRAIHRTAYCYGEDWTQPGARALSLGVFALASANSAGEKQDALLAIRQRHDLLDAAWRDGVERVAERELAKDATQFSLQTLAGRIGGHLGLRKSRGLAPLLGAVIGGAVNAGYVHDVARITRYVLQERWLRRRYPGLDLDAM